MTHDPLSDAIRRQSGAVDPGLPTGTPEDRELVAITKDFLAAMAAAGNPCVKERRRGAMQASALGWALRDGRQHHRDPYRVVTLDGRWLHYDPEWDRDRMPGTGTSGLQGDRPKAAAAAGLLRQALIGYGVVSRHGGDQPTLATTTDRSEVAAIMAADHEALYGEAAVDAWLDIIDTRQAPATGYDLIEIRGGGRWFGSWRFRETERSRAWKVGTNHDGRTTWLDERGLVQTEATMRDSSLPVDKRNAPRLVIVPRGAPLKVESGWGARPLNGVVLEWGNRPQGSAKAVATVLAGR